MKKIRRRRSRRRRRGRVHLRMLRLLLRLLFLSSMKHDHSRRHKSVAFCCRTTRPDARRQFRATQVNQQANNSTMTLVHLGLRTCDWMQRLKRLLTTRTTTTTYKVMWHGLVNHLGLGTCDWTQRLKPLLTTNTTTTTYKTTQQFFVTFWDSSRHTRQSCGVDHPQRDSKNADLTREQKKHDGVTRLMDSKEFSTTL